MRKAGSSTPNTGTLRHRLSRGKSALVDANSPQAKKRAGPSSSTASSLTRNLKRPRKVTKKFEYIAPYDIENDTSLDDQENEENEEEYESIVDETPRKLKTLPNVGENPVDNSEGNVSEDEENNSKESIGDENEDGGTFSISDTLTGQKAAKTPIDMLRSAVSNGSVSDIGLVIRKGFHEGTLSELQVEEVSRNMQRPNISLLQYFHETENSSEDQKASAAMGHMFLLKMALAESKTVTNIKASVNSLSSSISQHAKVGLLSRRTLETSHIIGACGAFPLIDLTQHYNKSTLVGDSAYTQITQILMKVFKDLLTPRYSIWNYSHRPKSVRATDKHFQVFPEEISEGLVCFAHDAMGVYLPDHLLHGAIDFTDPFIMDMRAIDKEKELLRRRDERENITCLMQQSIAQMLNYIRDYHYCVETATLENCKKRQNCTIHLTWKDVKLYRIRNFKGELSSTAPVEPKSLIGYYNRLISTVSTKGGKM